MLVVSAVLSFTLVDCRSPNTTRKVQGTEFAESSVGTHAPLCLLQEKGHQNSNKASVCCAPVQHDSHKNLGVSAPMFLIFDTSTSFFLI